MVEAKEYESGKNGRPRKNFQLGHEMHEVVMCWKDPNKNCKCDRPQRGVFCGRYPIPTD